tara:strand:- start:405 stop:1631 length:1227 start_codon:yes stop_codon:yes gene_type:complete
MKSILIDCTLGISGDMLVSALLDLGVPRSNMFDNLISLNIDKNYYLDFNVSDSKGIKGIVRAKPEIQFRESFRGLNDIKKLLQDSKLNDYVKKKSIKVFEILAEAESIVHGKEISDVHFHELGSIYSIIDIVNVCSAIDFLNPVKIYFSYPPAGKGTVSTSHGILPVPVPTVLEVARQNNIPLMSIEDDYFGEITTPTGIALIATFLDQFEQPDNINIAKIGIGLGRKNIYRPNFLRVLLIDMDENIKGNDKPVNEIIFSQEAWIDDSTPEDIAVLISRLRSAGAIDVISYSVDMKKNRKGICLKAIVSSEKHTLLRDIWFNYSTTIGLREEKISRWVLPRRTVSHKTKFGKVDIKQTIRPNGKISTKIEHLDLTRISLNTGIPIEEIRQEIFSELSESNEIDDWSIL